MCTLIYLAVNGLNGLQNAIHLIVSISDKMASVPVVLETIRVLNIEMKVGDGPKVTTCHQEATSPI